MLVNNAGLAQARPSYEAEVADWLTIQTNIVGLNLSQGKSCPRWWNENDTGLSIWASGLLVNRAHPGQSFTGIQGFCQQFSSIRADLG